MPHRPLLKTTIVIWSEPDSGRQAWPAADLAHDADSGDSYCSTKKSEIVQDPSTDPHWDNNSFFDDDDEDDEDDGGKP